LADFPVYTTKTCSATPYYQNLFIYSILPKPVQFAHLHDWRIERDILTLFRQAMAQRKTFGDRQE
jgi:hypothetical protein